MKLEQNEEGIVPQGWGLGTPQSSPPRHWCCSSDSNEKEPPRDSVLLQPKPVPVTLWTWRQCQHSCILLHPNLDGNPAELAQRLPGLRAGRGDWALLVPTGQGLSGSVTAARGHDFSWDFRWNLRIHVRMFLVLLQSPPES